MLKPQASDDDPDAPLFRSVAEVARLCRVSKMTLYRAIAAGEFPAVRIQGRLIVPAKAVEAMAQAALADHTTIDAADWVRPSAARHDGVHAIDGIAWTGDR